MYKIFIGKEYTKVVYKQNAYYINAAHYKKVLETIIIDSCSETYLAPMADIIYNLESYKITKNRFGDLQDLLNTFTRVIE
jgi:hypothetical protein